MDEYLREYQRWSDEKLQDEYRNRKRYEAKAVEAMEKLLLARGYVDFVEQRQIADGNSPSAIPPSLPTDRSHHPYEIATFGDLVSDAEFAKKAKTADGVYFDGQMVTGSSALIGNLLFVLGWVGLLWMAKFFLEDAEPKSLFIIGTLLSIFTILGSWFLRSSKKHRFKLFEDASGKLVFEVYGKFADRFEAPFRFQFASDLDKTQDSHKLQLTFYLEDRRKSILITETLTASKVKIPPNWQPFSTIRGQDYPREFGPALFKPIDLRRLKKILDGNTKEADL